MFRLLALLIGSPAMAQDAEDVGVGFVVDERDGTWASMDLLVYLRTHPLRSGAEVNLVDSPIRDGLALTGSVHSDIQYRRNNAMGGALRVATPLFLGGGAALGLGIAGMTSDGTDDPGAKNARLIGLGLVGASGLTVAIGPLFGRKHQWDYEVDSDLELWRDGERVRELDLEVSGAFRGAKPEFTRYHATDALWAEVAAELEKELTEP